MAQFHHPPSSPQVPYSHFPSFLHQSLDLCQCCANLGVPVVAANGWAAMKAIVLRNLSARRAARRRVEIFVWTVDDERQGSGD